jgi:hypothetical protein
MRLAGKIANKVVLLPPGNRLNGGLEAGCLRRASLNSSTDRDVQDLIA